MQVIGEYTETDKRRDRETGRQRDRDTTRWKERVR